MMNSDDDGMGSYGDAACIRLTELPRHRSSAVKSGRTKPMSFRMAMDSSVRLRSACMVCALLYCTRDNHNAASSSLCPNSRATRDTEDNVSVQNSTHPSASAGNSLSRIASSFSSDSVPAAGAANEKAVHGVGTSPNFFKSPLSNNGLVVKVSHKKASHSPLCTAAVSPLMLLHTTNDTPSNDLPCNAQVYCAIVCDPDPILLTPNLICSLAINDSMSLIKALGAEEDEEELSPPVAIAHTNGLDTKVPTN